MKAVIQRVSSASVRIDGDTIGSIKTGLLVLLAVAKGDTQEDMQWLCDKWMNLRIFPNEQGKFDHSLIDIGGELLIVSQFTLYGDCRKGRRPNFEQSAPPEDAEAMYEEAIEYCRSKGITTETGRFGAMMDVHLVNDGPVTIIIDSSSR